MCRAISLLKSRINAELIEEYKLESLAWRRGETTEPEILFDYAARVSTPYLPVVHAGQLCIYEWGNRSGKTEKLPKTGWCQQESLAAGKWRWLNPEPIVIPAQYGLEKGIWFHITEGLKGIAVQDKSRHWHAYMLTQAASVYYQNMTRHDRMPVLLGEQF